MHNEIFLSEVSPLASSLLSNDIHSNYCNRLKNLEDFVQISKNTFSMKTS